jgi:hypothetical protein
MANFDASAWLDQYGGGTTPGIVSPSNVDPWSNLNGMGDIAPLPGVQVGEAPHLNTDPNQYNPIIDQTMGRIGGAYDFNTPTAQTSLLNGAPQADLSQYGGSKELQDFLGGEGFSPKTLALMRTQAREAPAIAGRQQMNQMRRTLGEAGISGPAAAGYMGDVARNTGYQQGQNLQNVELGNADQAAKNKQFGVGMQTNIGLTNMQQANMLALQNANQMFEALRANQNAQNNMNQFNTGNQMNQQMSRAGQQGSYAANAGQLTQNQVNQNQTENANKDWSRDIMNTQYDWQKQTMPWEEQNKRFGQATGTLGSWGQQ